MIAEKTDIKQAFLANLVPTATMPGALVKTALENLETLQFPANKDEYWKYTRPTKIVNSTFKTNEDVAAVDIEPFKIPGLDAWRVVLVNGVFRADLSELDNVQSGIEILDLAQAQENATVKQYLGSLLDTENHIFSAINTVYASGGVAIVANEKVTAEKPVHIIQVQAFEDSLAQPRILIVAKKNSNLKVISSFKSTVASRTFTNVVAEMVVEQNAHLEYNKIQFENEESLQLSTEQVYQERDSYFSINTITLNGSWVRNNLNIVVDGENCETRLYGIYPLTGHQHVDNHTLVDHRQPHCESHELYKGILDGSSNGVFNGKVFVRKDAQKTNAFQTNNNIILSENAQVNTKPELEIYADDVKCSHGCTTGQFDDEAVFYLRSRGIGEKNARNLLVYAFSQEVLENITIAPVKELVKNMMADRFDWEH